MSDAQMSDESGVIAWFIKNPVAANLLMIMILTVGVATAVGLRIEGFPTLDPNTIAVEVVYESGDARQAEEGIAIKIEEALRDVPGIKKIMSTSTTKGVSIQIERDGSYNLDRLNSDVKNQVDGIFGFPSDAERPIVSKQLWRETALWISMYGETGQKDLQKVAQQFENALLALPSVKTVNRSGWRTPEIAIEVDELMLQAHDLTLDEVAQVVGEESLSETSGELRSSDGIILLKADKQRYHQREFSDIVVSVNPDGSTLRLSDVATIVDGFEESPNVLSRYQGQPAINLEIRVDRDDNIFAIANDAKQLLTEWQSNHRLPAGIKADLWWDQSVAMVDRLSLVLENGLIGIVLVMLVLTIFLNLRIAFWVAVGLPVCFAGGLIFMGSSFFDLTLNQLTTFGFVLVLGILVDDAVVVGESVHSAKQQLGDSAHATLIGVRRVAVPTMYGVLTTVAAFFPLSFVAGDLGAFFAQFALVCTGCLLFSLLESRLVLPSHLTQLRTAPRTNSHLPGRWITNIQRAGDTLVDWLRYEIYRPLVAHALRYRYSALSVFVSLFILIVGMVPSGKVGMDFFPDITTNAITVSYTVEQGVGYGVAHQQAERIEALVEELNTRWRDEYATPDDVIARIYVTIPDDQHGTVSMELSPKDERPLETEQIAESLRQELPIVEGIQELLVMTEDEDEKDIVLNLLSEDQHAMKDAADRIMHVLHSLEGVKDIHTNLVAGQPQLSFELTPEGRALGMTTEGLARQIQQGFFGAEVQRLQRGKDEVKVRVRYPVDQRKDVTNLQNARVRTPSGHIVPLSTVAVLNQEYTVTEINRIDGHRASTLSANIDESKIESGEVLGVLETTVFPHIASAYPQIQIFSDGDDAEEEESALSLLKIFAFSLLAIYILLAIPLKSYWQPLIIMSAIPFGLIGAIIGHWVGDLKFTILSFFGMLALSGVVVNDSLLLVTRYNELRQDGMDMHAALIEAGSRRMRAILLTSLTTCLGLFALLQETSEQAQILIPAANSLAYGIVFATLISLILVPVLLMIAEDLSMFGQRVIRSMFFQHSGRQSPGAV